MKIYVDLDHVDITEYTQIESGEYNTNKINFIFTPEYKNLVKVAIFGCKLDTEEPKFYKIYLSDDSCYLPQEVVAISDVISIGVYAFNVENGELKLRYSPTPVKTIVYEGSFREEAENSSSPTPTEIEQIMSRIISLEEITSDLNTRVEALENKACDLDSIKEDVETLKDDVEGISGRLDTVESDIDELEGDVANTYSKTEVDTLLSGKVDTSTYTTGQAAQDEKIAKAELILSQLPKVTGEGTNFSLSPTIEYKMDLELKGNTSQNTLTGKNLLNYNNLRTLAIDVGFVVDSDGNISDSTPDGDNRGFNYANSNWQMTLEAGTYTMTITFSRQITSTYGNCRIYDNNDTQLVYFTGLDLQNVSSVSKTFTLSGTTNIGIIFKIYSGICKIQLESGSTAHDWEPYVGGIPSPNPNYPQSINIVTGENSVVICGKNMFQNTLVNETYAEVTFTVNSDKTIKVNGTAQSTISKKIGTITLPTGSYKLLGCPAGGSGSGYLLRTSNGVNISSVFDTGSGATITVSEPSGTADIVIQIIGGTQCNNLLYKPMIIVSTDNTTYEPYKSQTYPVSLGTLELCKIGMAQDYIYYNNGKWYKYSIIDKHIFTGNEAFTYNSNYNGFRYQNDDMNLNSSNPRNDLVCTHFTVADARSQVAGNVPVIRVYNSTSDREYFFMCDGTSDVTTFKNWLTTQYNNNNPVTIIYKKYTPTSTEITDETLISQLNNIKSEAYSYNPTTNITQTNAGDPFIITATAFKKLS